MFVFFVWVIGKTQTSILQRFYVGLVQKMKFHCGIRAEKSWKLANREYYETDNN
jgi:hypothetical protein